MSEIIWDREENKRLDKILSARFQDLTKLENTIGYYWVEADDKENARKAVIELEALETNLKQVEANYDALQTPMPCGHLARYAVNEEEGTQYCCMCDREALMTASEVAANVLNKTVDCVQLLREVDDRVPGLLYDHYDENTVSLGVRINNAIIELDKVNNQ